MRWANQQLIFAPAGQAPWIGSHAALPVVQAVHDHHRLFFSSRDADGRSHIGYVELSLDHPQVLIAVSQEAVLSPGPLGTFDDAGVTTSCLVEHQGVLYLYYTGWTRGVSVPFYLNVGLAVSDDGGQRFRRVSSAPLLDRSEVDPYLTASPWIIVENGLWRMWYVSGTGWTRTADAEVRHHYHIKYAESADGLRWRRHGIVAIDYGSPGEYAFGRPCVVRDANGYRMWYSFRGSRYRMGYAESFNGTEWQRLDERNVLPASRAGWDSEMVTYPLVVKHRTRWCLFYNGNGYGRSGIGLATSE